MEKAGARNCWNGYSWHLYFGSQTDFAPRLASRLADLRSLKAAYGDRAPIWVTEAGWTTSGPFAVSEADQASALVRLRSILAAQPDVRAMIVHTLREEPTAQHSASPDPEYGYGVLHADWSPKPAYTALAH
jgi:exo-beta-1,3-glucanase (GH17 family)